MNNKKYALISVYDKTGVVELAKVLIRKKYTIISTGKTLAHLEKHSIPAVPVDVFTKNPESFDGRMKTISFTLESGILFDRKNKRHVEESIKFSVPKIDFVVCNFYPFWVKPGIDMIDIGGPTMVRAAAKNYKNVTVLVSPLDYNKVQNELEKKGVTSLRIRHILSATAFSYVAQYDGLISNYFQHDISGSDNILSLHNGQKLRYGENPHQNGLYFQEYNDTDPLSLSQFTKLSGKEMSFNNYLDLDAGLLAVSLIGEKKPSCVVIKHTNPCGASTSNTIESAFLNAWYKGDPLAAFGGIIVLNRHVTKKLAGIMLADNKFFEIVAAPSFDVEAIRLLKQKKNLRILQNSALQKPFLSPYLDFKRIRGGYLVQDFDTKRLQKGTLQIVTKKKPTKQQLFDLFFAWAIAQMSKSNCVVIVKNGTLLASGTGQQDRKRCCILCISKAGQSIKNAVAATDGFFPFRDGPDILIEAGISAIIQPGGSIRDKESIQACDEKSVVMITTGIRSFKH